MAGPGIRYFEMAKALSKNHQVTLLIPNEVEIASSSFAIKQQTKNTLLKYVKSSDVMISQLVPQRLGLLAKISGTKIILDVYDPMPIENLEVFKLNSDLTKKRANKHILDAFRFSFGVADTYIAASERQKDLWMGFLMSIGKITPQVYEENNTLTNLIDVVPFGLSSTPPSAEKKDDFRKRFGIKETDHVLLWGGGVWNWFDPLTLIRAIYEISKVRDDIYLVFMGMKHPNPHVPEMKMATDALCLSKELDLFEKKVFFNFGWTAYEERQSYLVGSTIGISLHFNNLETQYSFRTRILDYLWAGLPVIGTEGDYFAELIRKQNLGIVVPEKDVGAVKDAILTLVNNPHLRSKIKENCSKVQHSYYWETVVKPIGFMIEDLIKKTEKKISPLLYLKYFYLCFKGKISAIIKKIYSLV